MRPHRAVAGTDGSGKTQWRCTCGFTAYIEMRMMDHVDEHGERRAKPASDAEWLTGIKADIERAIFEARREGYDRALRDVLEVVESQSMSEGTIRTMDFIAGRIDQTCDEAVEKPWLPFF